MMLEFGIDLMDSKHSMTKHLRVMSSMIRDLKAGGNNLSDGCRYLLHSIIT